MGYGTGAIFGCPAHDQRDLDFARKYHLAVTPVVVPSDADAKSFAIGNEAYIGPGRLANSRFLDGMTVEEAKAEVASRLEKAGIGRAHGELPPARLAGVAPAPLGLPHPHGPLREVRRGGGEGKRPAGAAARQDRFLQERQSAGPRSEMEDHDLPGLRRPRHARHRHAGYLRRLVLVFRPLLRSPCRRSRSTKRRRITGCRWTSISAASSTRSCICSMRASSPAP